MTQRQSSAAPAIEADELVKPIPATSARSTACRCRSARHDLRLLGPNGAGKSTTVRILTTLARPDAGTASVAGIDVVRGAGAVRRTIGCVGQRSGGRPRGDGRENVACRPSSTASAGASCAAGSTSCWPGSG